jgi:ATPase subunit of ABC transporter with duplicated ATPase domains
LCRLLLQKPDIFLLDEPTNHLDAETVAWLERHLKDYTGTVIAVTHDRWFLDRIVTHILAFEDGEVVWYDGNWSEYAEWRREKLGSTADSPHRYVYRKLER